MESSVKKWNAFLAPGGRDASVPPSAAMRGLDWILTEGGNM